MAAISTIYFLCFHYITLFSCIQALDEKPISSDEQTTPLFIPRLNLGVLFSTHSILDNSNTYWYHIFKIDLLKSPPLPTVPLSSVCMNMPQLTQINVKFSICSLYELLIETYSQQANYLHADIDTNIDTVKTLLASHKHNLAERTRRGLFDFVGKSFKFLFGTATSSDINKFVSVATVLDDRVKNVEMKHNKLISDFVSYIDIKNRQNKQLTEAIEINYNRTEILSKDIQSTTKYMASLAHTVKDELQNIYNVFFLYNKFLITHVSLIDQRLAALHHMQIQSIEFLQSIQLLLTGKISPRLITQLQVKKLYKIISKHLQKNYPSFVITNPDINNFYDSPNYLFYAIDKHLYIQVKIPLSSYNAIFEVYKIISVPLPLNNNQSLHMYTSYELPSLLALSVDKNYYIDLSNEQYETCIGTPIRHCSHNIAIQTTSRPSCAVAIFMNQFNKISSICKSTLSLHTNLPQQIYSLGGNTYFVTGTQDAEAWTLNCEKPHLPSFPSCTLCTIHIPCSCSLHSTNFIIAKSLHTCDKETISSTSPTTQFHFNYNFLSNWVYNDTVLNSITAYSYLNYTPNIQLPPVLSDMPILPTHAFLENQEIKLDMKKIVNSLHDDTVEPNQALRSIFPHVFDKQSYSNSSTLSNIIHYIFHAFTIILIATIVILFLRVRHLTTLILATTAHTAIPLTDAFVLTPQLPNKQVTVNYIEFPATAFYIGCFILTFIMFIMLIFFLNSLKRYKEFLFAPMKYFFNRKSLLHTDILLECCSQTQMVILHLTTIPAHHSQLVIENPTLLIHNLISNCCSSYLRLNWNTTKLSIPGKFSNIALPEFLHIPMTCVNLTKQIVNDPSLNLTLLVGSNGYYHPTSVTNHNGYANRANHRLSRLMPAHAEEEIQILS